MQELGEIHERTDTRGHGRYVVAVVSHNLYRDGTGMVFVVPVHPDSPGVDHPLLIRVDVSGEVGLIIADQVFRMPAAGLGDPPVGRVEPDALERVRAQLRGIFS
ncbi:MAG TPA: type II toxin-antitoxin system PemK/MazF family toxin [Candidatus Limnocylindrales bacterium]|nr:type II toxin-antitoxin system PemK/MazF family toxin [Candidatus Limnocylindrales bacterium]